MNDTPLFVVEPDESKQEAGALAPITSNALIERALAHPNADQMVTVIEKLIAMKNAEEDRTAEKKFYADFAEMQKDLPVVTKTKLNKATGSYYADLETLQAAWDPILITKHGFAYSWREEMILDGAIKRTWFDLCKHGFRKSTSFDAPRIEPNKAQNSIMVSGVQSTYGYRYTYRAGVGGRVEGEDSDGQIEIDAELAATLEKIKTAPDLDTLMNLHTIARERYADEPNKRTLVSGAYAEKKNAIAKGQK